ncbi:MAG: IS1 family transposase [Stenomitos frigidus ULC029]
MPRCTAAQRVKNGRIYNSKQRFKCQDCGRQVSTFSSCSM